MPVREGALEPCRIEVHRDGRRGGGPLEPALFRGPEHTATRRHELVEERGQLPGRLDLDALPEPDLREARPMTCLLEVRRHAFEATGDRVQPLGERGVIAREQQEQAVTDRVQRQRSALPDAQLVGLEDRASDVVHLEVALEADLGGEVAIVEGLDGGEVLAVGRDLREDRVAPAVAELIVVGVDAEVRRRDGFVAKEAPEPPIDEVIERRVEGTGGRRCGRARQGRFRGSVRDRQTVVLLSRSRARRAVGPWGFRRSRPPVRGRDGLA